MNGAAGTHEWIQDGPIASYNARVLAIQHVDISHDATGNLTLALDMTSYDRATGRLEYSTPIGVSGSALELQASLEDMDSVE